MKWMQDPLESRFIQGRMQDPETHTVVRGPCQWRSGIVPVLGLSRGVAVAKGATVAIGGEEEAAIGLERRARDSSEGAVAHGRGRGFTDPVRASLAVLAFQAEGRRGAAQLERLAVLFESHLGSVAAYCMAAKAFSSFTTNSRTPSAGSILQATSPVGPQ